MEKGKNLKDSIDPVDIEGTKTILAQMMNCICKIKIKGKFGTGFFCKIPFRKESINVFVTSYYILDEKDYKENKKINLSLNDDKDILTIDLGVDRETYFNKDYDIALIEIREEDNIINYLELDDNLFQDNSEINYINGSIYVLHYLNGKNASVSYGLINNIDKYKIIHNCIIDKCSSWSPILNLKSNKVIGMHKDDSINYIYWIFIKITFKGFY